MKKNLLFLASALLVCTACDPAVDVLDERYQVIVTFDDHGTAFADATSASEGQKVLLTAVPDEGYAFSNWTIEQGAVSLGNTASVEFDMPASTVQVKAVFVVENRDEVTEKGVVVAGVKWATVNVETAGVFAANRNTDTGMGSVGYSGDLGQFFQFNARTAFSEHYPLKATPTSGVWAAAPYDVTTWESVNNPCPTGWRLPSVNEFGTLFDDAKTTRHWINVRSTEAGPIGYVYGMEIVDKADALHSIFLPAAGCRAGEQALLLNGPDAYTVGANGYYWTGENCPSGPEPVAQATYVNISNGWGAVIKEAPSNYGCTVRCVGA